MYVCISIYIYDIMYINYICACICICMCMLKRETVHKFNGPSNNKSNTARCVYAEATFNNKYNMYDNNNMYLIICIP